MTMITDGSKFLYHTDIETPPNLLETWDENLEEPWKDPKSGMESHCWNVLYSHKHEYFVQHIKNILNLSGRVSGRYYNLMPNHSLRWHTDRSTTCSFNFLLEGNGPVQYKDENENIHEFFYKQALLNTSVPHHVPASDNRRIIFKVSIFGVSYEEVLTAYKKEYE